MDTARLAETLNYLDRDERQYGIQEKLVAVKNALTNLTSNPAEPTHQTNFAKSLDNLSKVLTEVSGTYNPSQRSRISDLGARPYFSPTLASQIRRSVAQNPISPSVTLDLVNTLIESRQEFLERVKQTLVGLEDFELDRSELDEGEADVGFELPRELFSNRLHGLINELRSIQRIIRVISEVETGSVCDPELHDISASDPIFFLGADPITIASIAGVATWALSQWKKIEEIRKLRTETKKSKSFTEREVAEFFDSKIKRQIDKAVDQKAAELIEMSKLPQSRKNELDSEVEWALRAVLARVERGMKIEVRFIEPAEVEDEKSSEVDKPQMAAMSTISKLAERLVFPKTQGKPVLALPAVKDADPLDANRPRRKRSRKKPPAKPGGLSRSRGPAATPARSRNSGE